MNRATDHEVRLRAGERCEYCRLPQSLSRLKFTIDHILAKQHGGSDLINNLALACGHCNRHKGPNIAAGIDLPSGQLNRLFHPRQDIWSDHFVWREAILVGLTPIGRTTVAVLLLNSRSQIAVRQNLIAEGAFLLP